MLEHKSDNISETVRLS